MFIFPRRRKTCY